MGRDNQSLSADHISGEINSDKRMDSCLTQLGNGEFSRYLLPLFLFEEGCGILYFIPKIFMKIFDKVPCYLILLQRVNCFYVRSISLPYTVVTVFVKSMLGARICVGA